MSSASRQCLKGHEIARLLEQDIDDVSRWAYGLGHSELIDAIEALAGIVSDGAMTPLVRLKAAMALKALPPHGRHPLSTELWPRAILKRAQESLYFALMDSNDRDLQAAFAGTLRRITDLAGKTEKSRFASRLMVRPPPPRNRSIRARLK